MGNYKFSEIDKEQIRLCDVIYAFLMYKIDFYTKNTYFSKNMALKPAFTTPEA